VYETLGKSVLGQALGGFNSCIFAYGQTGAGKTHSMMGVPEDVGIVPRMCDDLFANIATKQNAELKFKVEVSYFEVYNEQVFDLLKPSKKVLKVRNHKSIGPYVEGLVTLAVNSFEMVNELMEQGFKNRTTASTAMNDASSRSHAVFTIKVHQQRFIASKKGADKTLKKAGTKSSKISLVDLAGSERQQKTGASGARLKEGSTINKSLTTLGMVISALADASKPNKAKGDIHVPYRDSTLTFLLKESLGGNSKTVMVAAVSPADDNFEESMSTLRWVSSFAALFIVGVERSPPPLPHRHVPAETRGGNHAACLPPRRPVNGVFPLQHVGAFCLLKCAFTDAGS
jgi:kinesin family protein 13